MTIQQITTPEELARVMQTPGAPCRLNGAAFSAHRAASVEFGGAGSG